MLIHLKTSWYIRLSFAESLEILTPAWVIPLNLLLYSVSIVLAFLLPFACHIGTEDQQNSGNTFSSIYDLASRKKAYPGNFKIYHRQSLLPWTLHLDISLTLFPSLFYLVHLWSLSLSNILGRSTLSGPPSLSCNSPGGSFVGWEGKRNWQWLFWITFLF